MKAKKGEINEIDRPLTAKQKRFADFYVKYLNGAKAAREAGYSERSCTQISSELLAKPNVKKYVSELLEASGMSAAEAIKRISDIGRTDLSDYMVERKVEQSPRIEKKLKDLIADLEGEIAFEEEVRNFSEYTDSEEDYHIEAQRQRQNLLIRYRLELKHNPKATKIVYGSAKLVKRMELDLVKIVQDKERGKIKSYSNTAHGIKIETYSADEALINIGRMHGVFEKDNKQKVVPQKLKIGYAKKGADGTD